MCTLKHVAKMVSICILLLSLSVTSVLGVTWPSCRNRTPHPHTIFGDPVYVKHDPNHNITRTHRAFTVYYDDQVLAPRWTGLPPDYVPARSKELCTRSVLFGVGEGPAEAVAGAKQPAANAAGVW